MSSNTWDKTSMIGRLLLGFHNNELDNLDKQLFLGRFSSIGRDNQCFYALRPLPEEIRTSIQAVCVISLNYGECDTATRNGHCA